MARRLFPDNDAWGADARRASNDIAVALADVLALLESDGPVDLRDFHYVATEAVSSFVSGLSIRRRLGDPDTPPDSIIRAIPGSQTRKRQASSSDSAADPVQLAVDILATMDPEWNGGTLLARTLARFHALPWDCYDNPIGVCQYDSDEDPAHDFCVHCEKPEERK